MKIVNQNEDIIPIKDDVFLHYTGSMLGIACKANSITGIEKIKKLKERPDSKGMIMLCDSISMVLTELKLKTNHKGIIRFLGKIWPGNVTVILENHNSIYQTISENGKIAVRIPDDALLRQFIHENGPIISTSVNKSGTKPCNSLADINAYYESWFDFALLPQGITRASGIPSTIIEIKYQKNSLTFNILREGSVSSDCLKQVVENITIAFACVGNICRSPIAEYYARETIGKSHPNIHFSSCGLLEDGIKISRNSEIILKEWGINPDKHRSARLNTRILGYNDYILTMTKDVKERMLSEFPEGAGKIFSLGEFTGFNQDIEDPYGMDLNCYQKTALQIKQMIDQLNVMIQNNEI